MFAVLSYSAARLGLIGLLCLLLLDQLLAIKWQCTMCIHVCQCYGIFTWDGITAENLRQIAWISVPIKSAI